MIDPREPKYAWGQSVVAAVDLYNDGSVPEVPEDHLLIVAGGPGEIVQIGHHAEANLPLYMVDFGLCVLGCLEEELLPAAEAGRLLAAPAAAPEALA
ncbi:nitrogen fixation protein NifZ [Ideonella sp. A 288]|uniref:nitrogen fixation protein NifZ n=1 Tax=Ideonella sp. A 288 TaxID=1962181 RepID=UPI000B4BE1AC|nr:nitrogen fixation protein NifZ [Ideonella sp. A 288]